LIDSERIRRFIDVNDYLKDKKNEEANALVPEIKQLGHGVIMSWIMQFPRQMLF